MTRAGSTLAALVAAVALVGGGCAAAATRAPAVAPSERPAATLPAGAQTIPPSEPPVTGEVPAPVLEAARAALAAAVGAEAAASAEVEVGQAVTWPDGSLGCPEPGVLYTQATVPGYQVVFVVDGTRYDYRIGTGADIRRCEGGRPRG